MSEHNTESPEITPSERENTAMYPGGKVEYSIIGEPNEHNPVILIPGFTEGRFVARNFAHTLHKEGDRQVIYSDQPELDKKAKIKLPILDHHAEAVLAVIEREGLGEGPVDFIAHSFGAIVLTRAAELAKERGLSCFESEKGSHAVFTSPAGTNHKEKPWTLGGRWMKFVWHEANPLPVGNFYTRQLDPTGEMLKAGQNNANANKLKTLRELGPLFKKESMYKRLGELGVKPFIIGYSHDLLTPHKSRKTAVELNKDYIAGYSMPIDSEGKGVKLSFSRTPTLKEFESRMGLTGKAAKKAWIHHYVGAGHADRLFHPKRTVRAILPILNEDALQRVKAAEKQYITKPKTVNKITV